MIVYISAIIISIFFAYLAVLSKIRNKYKLAKSDISYNIIYKIFAVISFLPLFLVSAFRYYVGTDYFPRYVLGLLEVKSGNKNVYEIGFRMFNKLILMFTDDYAWLFIITSFIFCAFIYKTIYEQSVDVCFSILLLLITNSYFISMNAVRQSICIAIFMYSIKYIKQGNLLKYMICICIAATIHISSLIYIPVYFISKIKINVKIHMCILALIVVFSPLISKIFIYIVLRTKYAFYFSTSFNTGNISFWKLLINISVLLLCYIMNSKIREDKYCTILINLQFIAVILLMFSNHIPLMDRVVMYFTFLQILLLPRIISYIRLNWVRFNVKACIISFYTIYMINTIIVRGYEGVLPYQTIFTR
ncbi:EpsG family protein [uncultured Clostridium sp.]|uniref:EpsG family protein n=1 Tax=uncultured Clostridium sp. TaxID=59620 RepID=UPI0025ECEF44|nr:EpsG family protein [uncultured Clostridium sp.]